MDDLLAGMCWYHGAVNAGKYWYRGAVNAGMCWYRGAVIVGCAGIVVLSMLECACIAVPPMLGCAGIAVLSIESTPVYQKWGSTLVDEFHIFNSHTNVNVHSSLRESPVSSEGGVLSN